MPYSAHVLCSGCYGGLHMCLYSKGSCASAELCVRGGDIFFKRVAQSDAARHRGRVFPIWAADLGVLGVIWPSWYTRPAVQAEISCRAGFCLIYQATQQRLMRVAAAHSTALWVWVSRHGYAHVPTHTTMHITVSQPVSQGLDLRVDLRGGLRADRRGGSWRWGKLRPGQLSQGPDKNKTCASPL